MRNKILLHQGPLGDCAHVGLFSFGDAELWWHSKPGEPAACSHFRWPHQYKVWAERDMQLGSNGVRRVVWIPSAPSGEQGHFEPKGDWLAFVCFESGVVPSDVSEVVAAGYITNPRAQPQFVPFDLNAPKQLLAIFARLLDQHSEVGARVAGRLLMDDSTGLSRRLQAGAAGAYECFTHYRV